MTEIWNTLIVWPLEGSLKFFYDVLGSYGLAIIVFTVVIKLVTFPLTYQQVKSSKAMKEVQPLLEEAKKRAGKDRERLSQETMQIYREHGVNPAMGCLPMLIQMPIWFGLYYALLNLSQTSEEFNQGFLWLPSLGQPDPFYILVALTVVTQFVVQKMMTMPSNDPTQKTMNQVMLVMPLTFGFFAATVPSGLAIYWVTTNVFTFFQQLLTTGWGELWPSRQRQVSPPRFQPSTPRIEAAGSNGIEDEESGPSEGSRTPKAAKHKNKKRSGSRASREDKRANGKR